MVPLGWLLHLFGLSDGDVVSWWVVNPDVLLLGIVISLACHRAGVFVRARER